MTSRKIFSSLKWIYYVSRRFSKVDRKGRTAVTSALASLGVGFGVLALIVVIGVMNGFQMEFIDAILEISSYHVRVENQDNYEEFCSWCKDQKIQVRGTTSFYEAQALAVGPSGSESAALIRAVGKDVMDDDPGFASEMHIVSGSFDLSADDSIVLGNELARLLKARVGDSVNIFALSGSSDVSLFSSDRKFTVTGIFHSGYSDINASFSFINTDAGKANFGKGAKKVIGVKLADSNRDAIFISAVEKAFPSARAESWRNFNRSFFGALRVEKNIIMLLVLLIFVVVAVNIYNAMRRMVYERREEIAVLSALGGTKQQVQAVFIVKGFTTGFFGAMPGLIAGLLLCANMGKVFMFLSKVQFCVTYFFMMIANPVDAAYVMENPMFRIYASIPARTVFSEVISIFLFGIFSSLASSWLAGREILKLNVSEVLRDE
ncbi:MAG: ABC transporter permease [Treponema sp.]|nr:ABC transporter permease [Treponema sp.]